MLRIDFNLSGVFLVASKFMLGVIIRKQYDIDTVATKVKVKVNEMPAEYSRQCARLAICHVILEVGLI